MAQLMAKENGYALLKTSSGELRNVSDNCMATIGVVSNLDHENVNYGKGRTCSSHGRKTYSKRFCNEPERPPPAVVKVSHRWSSRPVTPWGQKPALGYKTKERSARAQTSSSLREETASNNYYKSLLISAAFAA